MFMRGSLLRCVYAYSMFNKWPEAAPILRGLGPVAVLMDYIVISAMYRCRPMVFGSADTAHGTMNWACRGRVDPARRLW